MEEASNIEKQRKEMTRLTLCDTYLLWCLILYNINQTCKIINILGGTIILV